MKKVILFTFAMFLLAGFVSAQELEKFKADLGKKVAMGKEVRLPYTSIISYFGYVTPDAKPDEMRDGKKFYYLYLWIPAAAPEIGVRMISPIPGKEKPGEGDFVSPAYTANASETTQYFDTWITLEKADGIQNITDLDQGFENIKWNQIEVNDDSGEMPAQPSGSKYNSLFRVTSDINDPKKSLTIGLYRIGFTTYKTGEVTGGFLAQIGAPIKLPGVILTASIEEIKEKLKLKKTE